MAVKTRARAILIPIVFYLVLGSASAWLVWGASQGERGLTAKAQNDAEYTQLQSQLASFAPTTIAGAAASSRCAPKRSIATCSTRRRATCSIASARTTW